MEDEERLRGLSPGHMVRLPRYPGEPFEARVEPVPTYTPRPGSAGALGEAEWAQGLTDFVARKYPRYRELVLSVLSAYLKRGGRA